MNIYISRERLAGHPAHPVRGFGFTFIIARLSSAILKASNAKSKIDWKRMARFPKFLRSTASVLE